MNSLRTKQLIISSQIILGMVICYLAWESGPGLFTAPEISRTPDRLVYLVPWLLVPALAVLLFTVITMTTRLLSKDAIDGTPEPASRFLAINLRITRNTLEQAFLAVIAWLGLAIALPPDRITLIPVLAILFGAGRMLFWIGYLVNPSLRSLGFALTALPTAVSLMWLAWNWL